MTYPSQKRSSALERRGEQGKGRVDCPTSLWRHKSPPKGDPSDNDLFTATNTACCPKRRRTTSFSNPAGRGGDLTKACLLFRDAGRRFFQRVGRLSISVGRSQPATPSPSSTACCTNYAVTTRGGSYRLVRAPHSVRPMRQGHGRCLGPEGALAHKRSCL